VLVAEIATHWSAAGERLSPAHGVLEAVLAMAQRAGADAELARILGLLGVVQGNLGDGEMAIASLEEACRLAVEYGDADAIGPAFINMSYVLAELGRWEESVRAALEGYEVTREAGLDRLAGGYLLGNAAYGHLVLGRWDEAERLLGEVELLGCAQAPLLAAELALRRGRFNDVQAALDRYHPVGRRPDSIVPYALALAELRIWQGRIDEARQALLDALPTVIGAEDVREAGWLLCLAVRAEADRAQRGRHLHVAADVRAAVRHVRALWRTAQTATVHPLDPRNARTIWPAVNRLLWDAELSRLHNSRRAPARWWRTASRVASAR
jgi:tetratricopeptide (TPR) repeat protein